MRIRERDPEKQRELMRRAEEAREVAQAREDRVRRDRILEEALRRWCSELHEARNWAKLEEVEGVLSEVRQRREDRDR